MPSDREFEIAEKLGNLRGDLNGIIKGFEALSKDIEELDEQIDGLASKVEALEGRLRVVEDLAKGVQKQHAGAALALQRVEQDLRRDIRGLGAALSPSTPPPTPRENSNPDLRPREPSNPNVNAVAKSTSPSGPHPVLQAPPGDDLAQDLASAIDGAGKIAAFWKKRGAMIIGLVTAAIMGALAAWKYLSTLSVEGP